MSSNTIRLSKSTISQQEKDAVAGVLDREFLGMGEDVKEFENALTNFFGRQAVCVVNGTAALHLACQGVGLGAGDEVLVQSLTYIASFQSISAAGAIPVACDVLADTLTIDLEDAQKRITPRTKAIMPVHYASGVGNLDEVYRFAKKNNLRVIEDAAHAFGSEYCGNKIGSIGDITCFSFDGIKNITAGEGGCIVSDDVAVMDNIRNARALGINVSLQSRYHDNSLWSFGCTSQGWRYHMSNIMAAIGLEQLKKFPLFSEKRKSLAKYYNELLRNSDHIQPLYLDFDEIVPHIYVVKVMVDRDKVKKYMVQHGIEVGIHYFPNHNLQFYKAVGDLELSVTDEVFPKLLTLPMHIELTEEDVKYVCDHLVKIVTEINE